MGRAAAAASSAARATRRGVERCADQVGLRLARTERPRSHGAERDPGVGDAAARVQRHPGGDAHDRDRAAALQSELVPGLPAAVTRHHDLADQLARPGDRAARPQQEGVERDRPLVAGPREDDRGIERQQGNHKVGAGARIREVPAQRRLVPREEVREVPRRRAERGSRAATSGDASSCPTVTPPPIRVTPLPPSIPRSSASSPTSTSKGGWRRRSRRSTRRSVPPARAWAAGFSARRVVAWRSDVA